MNFGLEAKVGVFVLGCLILIGAMSLRLVDFSFGKSKGVHVKTMLTDAAGLAKDAPVIYRGVEVGKVKDLKLENGRAVADLNMDEQYQLPKNVEIAIRSKGFLGEKYAELKLIGKEPKGILQDGDVIHEAGQVTDFDQLGNKLGDIADDVKAITSSLRQVLATDKARDNMTTTISNVREITDTVNKLIQQNEKRIDMIVRNMDTLTSKLSQITVANADNINSIVANINSITKDLKAQTPLIAENLKVVTDSLRKDGPTTMANVRNISEDVNDVVSSQKDNLKKAIQNIATVSSKLEKTVDNLNSITGKIDQGKGSIGKLVNDEKTVDNLNGALESVRDTLGKVDQFKVDLAFSAERYGSTDNNKGHMDIKISPSDNKYYLIGLSSDEAGHTKTTNTTTDTSYTQGSATNGDTSVAYTEHKTEQNPDAMLWTLQYAHRFWDDFFFRVGMYESDAGIGLDYYPLKGDLRDKLVIKGDVYDFPDKGDSRKARTKLGAKYVFYKNLFVTAGYSDFFNKESDSWFVGAGVQFRDDDLKYLLGKTPMPTN